MNLLSLRRDTSIERDELLNDVIAVGVDENGRFQTDEILSRPTLLRRVAAGLAERLPATTDRLIATSADAPLATAVSLHTGIAFALVEPHGQVRGELYPSDNAAAIRVAAVRAGSDIGDEAAADALRQAGAVFSLVGEDNALFRPSELTVRWIITREESH